MQLKRGAQANSVRKSALLAHVKDMPAPSNDTTLAAEVNLPGIAACIKGLAQRDVVAPSFAQALQLGPAFGRHSAQAPGSQFDADGGSPDTKEKQCLTRH